MYTPSFRSCWTLINRAKQHRDAIHKYLAATFGNQANLARISAKREPGFGYHSFRINTVPDLSKVNEQISAMAGDVICNLRFALDHISWQLACVHTGGNPQWPRRVQFPIEDDPDVFTERCNKGYRGWIFKIAPADQTKIERFQPYHGRDPSETTIEGPYVHQLALLRDLTDVHKHRTLTEIILLPRNVMFVPGILPGGMKHIDFLLFTNMPHSDAFEVGTEVMRAVLPPTIPAHVKVAAYCTPAIAFNEKRPVIATLDRIASYIVRILRKFDPVT